MVKGTRQQIRKIFREWSFLVFMVKKYSPLSQTQLGIYRECLQMKNKFAYNTHVLVTIDKSIDMEQLARSIEKVFKVKKSRASEIVSLLIKNKIIIKISYKNYKFKI